MTKPDINAQTVRIPLIGNFNQRLFGPAAGAASGYVGIGIVGTMVIGASSLINKDQRFINAIPDIVKNPLTNNSTYYCYKRPGLETHTTPQSGSIGTAIRVWTGQGSGNKIISAFGSGASTIYDGTSSLGILNGVALDITETTVGTTANLVIPTENNLAYYYPDGGSLTRITSINYPGNLGTETTTGSFVHMDGYAFIMTQSGRIYNSDLGSVSSWTSTSFLSSNMYPDQGVGLSRYKDLVVAFGKETIQFFKNVGNAAGSPLQNVAEAFIKIGAISSSAITQLEDNVSWVASSDTGSISVYLLDGYKPVRISDNTIDAQLGVRGDSPVFLSSVKIFGKTFIFLVFGTFTFVYCVEDKIWHEWRSTTVLWHKWAANTAASSTLYSISRSDTAGKIFRINPVSPVYQDNGVNYTMTIQTSKIDLGNEKRKFLDRLTLVADDTSSATNMSVSWSDDDYDTFTTARTIALASDRKYLSNCGQFRRRALKLENTSAIPIRVEALELEIRQGGH